MYDKKLIEGLTKIQEGIELLLVSLNSDTVKDTEAVKATEERKVDTPVVTVENTPEAEPKQSTAHFDEEDLTGMSYNDLKKLAKEVGVSGAGMRDKIISRILEVDLAVDTPAENASVEEEVTEEKPSKKTAKVVDTTEPDPLYRQVLEATEDMSVEELGDILSEIGISPKGKKQSLIDKIYKAVVDGKLSFDEDDTEDQYSSEEVDTEDGYADDEEEDDVNNPDNMTDARREACEQYAESIQNDFDNGEITIADIREFCLEFYGDSNVDAIYEAKDGELLDLYIDAVKRMIDDEGDLVEEGAYEVNGEYFCCGRPLQYAEETNKYICEMCGEEYDAE